MGPNWEAFPTGMFNRLASCFTFGHTCTSEHYQKMSPVTPQAVQDLLDQLERNREARKRAWLVLQSIRARLERWHGEKLPQPSARSFDGEGATLAIFIDKLLTDRHVALDELCKAIRRFQATVFDESRLADRAGAHQAVLKALDAAEECLAQQRRSPKET